MFEKLKRETCYPQAFGHRPRFVILSGEKHRM